MKATVLILCSQNPDNCDSSLAKLAEYLGLDHRFVLPHELFSGTNFFSDIKDKGRMCLALSSQTLEAIHRDGNLIGFLAKLFENVSFIFLYGVTPGNPPNDALNILTDGIIRSVLNLPHNNFSYSVSSQFIDISKQFSGLTFESVNNQVDFVFDIGKASRDADTIISIDNRPMFLRIRRGDCNVFALSTGRIQDIQDMENGSITAAKHFSALVPALMLLKHVFGGFCWQPGASHACLIIDDPLLHKKYGFLDYKKLLKTMLQDGFFSTLAFIPWNFRRTQPGVAELFKKNTDKFSICVHGCDHTAAEFGLTDFGEIDCKIKLATKRMMLHQELTGLGFDHVMVFPQGVFSTTSMKALKSNNYAAAFNSGIFPIDSSNSIKISELLQQSIMYYENFPLFHRRYPDSIADFALDLFLGKPALIVAHHDYFREGYEGISGFVRKLNSLDANIRWRGLEEIVRESYWVKQESETQIYLKMCSNTLHIVNNSAKAIRYLITKYETNNVPLDGVFVNGNEVEYVIADQLLRIDIDIRPQASGDVTIVYRNQNTGFKEKRGTLESLKIFIRRHLSEIRDNYICKNLILLAFARKVIHTLHM